MSSASLINTAIKKKKTVGSSFQQTSPDYALPATMKFKKSKDMPDKQH